MSYTPTSWVNGELVSADDMNRIEQGIAGAAAGGATDPAFAAVIASPTSATRAALNTLLAVKAPLPSAARNPLTGWFHADGYGAPSDGTGDASTGIQAAVDAAESLGGGVVYLPEKYRITTGILLPSNVTLRGNNSGAQPGTSGSYSRIVYAGAAGGTVISPKYRTTDTVNWGIHGLRIDGGGLADIIVEAYRVAYSRFTDLSIVGGQAVTGVGFVLDANVSGKCYFNVTDGVKIDGLATGVRFTRGANANRWLGGKVGNGGTGMEFLSLSAGNLVEATDLEENTIRHVYVDSPANVFVGLHMEISPIGYEITANGASTRRLGTTFASTVTAYASDASAVAGWLDEYAKDAYELRLGSSSLKSTYSTTTTQVSLDSGTYAGTANLLVNLFRFVTTTGLRQLNIYKGDGTSTKSFALDFATATMSIGAVGLGGGVGGLGIVNRTTAPATNPSGGGFLYVESGALKFKGSAGTVTTVAPA